MMILLLLLIWTTLVSCRPIPQLHVESHVLSEMENILDPPRTSWLLDMERSAEFLQDMKFGVIAAIPLIVLLIFLIISSIILCCLFCRKKPEP